MIVRGKDLFGGITLIARIDDEPLRFIVCSIHLEQIMLSFAVLKGDTSQFIDEIIWIWIILLNVEVHIRIITLVNTLKCDAPCYFIQSFLKKKKKNLNLNWGISRKKEYA